MLKKLITGAAIVALTGCSSLGDVFISGTNAAYVLDINGGSVETLILKADLSDDEVETVISARETIHDLRDKFSKIEVQNLVLLHVDYYAARDAYESVYNIVVAHENEYTVDEWQAFTDSHEVALQLDEAVNEYIISADASTSSTMFIQYLTAIAKLAVLL